MYSRHARAVTPITRQPEQAIVLAALDNGVHVQVGNPSNREGAHALWTVLDADLGTAHGRGRNPHTIGGRDVRFYRVREGSHEFGNIAKVSVNRVARNARKAR